jgi:transglutaminase-like putative cysteine protease
MRAAVTPGASVLDYALELTRRIADDIDYVERLEPGVQSPSDTLRLQSGACRDSAWLLVQLLRQAGIAARFVSGYLVGLGGPGSGSENDALAFHAWVDFYLVGAGWIGLDATSGRQTSLMHIPLAAGPVPQVVGPVEGGLLEPAEDELRFSMRARRVAVEAPSP